MLALVVGCAQQLVAVVPAPARALQISAAEVVEREQQKKIRQYLFNAFESLDNGRLMRPKNDNAYDWFNQVLWLDNTHPEAHRGMREIGKVYLYLAEEAYKQEDRDRAELILERSQWVSASAEEVKRIKKSYPPRPQADNEYRLVLSDLNSKTEQLLARLSELAMQAKSLPSRLLIVARSDSEARWLYKQMRSSVEGYRLRGNIQVGRVPRIVLIDQPKKVVQNINMGSK
ncbi:MAG: hypothetical protein ACJA0N_002083 [Pseudohongiellaceae bacterium]|jgi:hypothetical protein